jgi:hypothetical protein
MIFRFEEYKYAYSYRPDVIVFARTGTYQGRTVVVYKLLIPHTFIPFLPPDGGVRRDSGTIPSRSQRPV